MSMQNKVAKSTLIIIIFTLGSKFLGFLRDILIAFKFGSGMETDTFFIALTATSVLVGFLSDSIYTTFIPIISEIESKEGKERKIEHTNNIINIIFMLSVILLIITFIGAPILVKIFAKGFEGEQFQLAVKLTRIGTPIILFGGIIKLFTGYLQSEQEFARPAATGIISNFIYIIFLIFFSSIFGIKGLMVVAVLAMVSQLLILLPKSKSIGYRYEYIIDFKDKYIEKILFLSIPVLIGVAINDLNAIVDRTLASELATGSISALNYANKLNVLILSVFVTAITTVIFPLLSKESNEDNIPGMKKIMMKGVNLILLITIPATVGLIILSKPIVQVAFERGVFDTNATLMTSQALMFYAIGLVAMGIRILLTRVYYSLQDTKTPMVNGAISVGLNIILNIILVKYMAHSGLALATSISAIIASILLLYGLKKKIGSFGTKIYITTFLKTGLASAIMGVVAYLIYHGLYGALGVSKVYNLISLLVAVSIAAIVYVVLCYVFKVEEVRDVIDKIKARLIK